MSYRVYVNDYQCLGNNEFPEVLRKALNQTTGQEYIQATIIYFTILK